MYPPQHIVGKRHRRFAENDSNFAALDEIFNRLAPQASDNLFEEPESDEDGLEIVDQPSDAQFFNEQFRRGLRRRSSQEGKGQYRSESLQSFSMSLQKESAFHDGGKALNFMNGTNIDMDDPFIVH